MRTTRDFESRASASSATPAMGARLRSLTRRDRDILRSMSVSSLREITVGVRDLYTRISQFESGCGLAVLATGPLAPPTASRLFDTHVPPGAAVMGRRDVEGSPRIRLVEAGDLVPGRASGIGPPGPLGIGFTTLGIWGGYARLERAGVQFVSPPLLLTPMKSSPPEGSPPGPQIGRAHV